LDFFLQPDHLRGELSVRIPDVTIEQPLTRQGFIDEYLAGLAKRPLRREHQLPQARSMGGQRKGARRVGMLFERLEIEG
jgi:hypothetical protein